MTETIPADIMETAKKVIEDMAVQRGMEFSSWQISFSAEAIAAALLAERQRCAEVARDMGPATQDMASTMICEALDRAAAAILTPDGEKK